MSDQFVGLGVDVGGTFTDAVVLVGDQVWTAKRATTPSDQSIGVIAAAIAALDRAHCLPSDVTRFVHGMTVTTNALLENKISRTALVATAGFEDLEELGRQNRPSLYDLDVLPPPPLTRREDRIGARERCGPAGIIKALDTESLEAAIRTLDPDVQSVAVNLLFSFRYPAHEREIAQIIRNIRPDLHVSLSHEVVGTFREFERLTTTATDAAVTPLVGGYLGQLRARASDAGLPEPLIMLSNGGVAPLRLAASRGSLTVLSGPAGGAAGGALAAVEAGFDNALCFDMGGTSTDVSLVRDGLVAVTAERGIGGRPFALPAVDIVTVGAGGGSIGWRDDGGGIAVGPHSAGAEPGPAAYDHGGLAPTVTDANLVLGYLADGQKFGDEIVLDLDLARQAIGRLADELNLGVEQTASGIVRVANAEMAGALREVSVARGFDPRQFALIAFGGAGGLHCAWLARELEMSRAFLPSAAGTLSALGMLQAPLRADAAQSLVRSLDDIDDDQLEEVMDEVAERARALLDDDQKELEHIFEMRYVGQSHEIATATAQPSCDLLRNEFERLHSERYGYMNPDRAIELVTVRASAQAKPLFTQRLAGEQTPESASVATQMWFEGLGWTQARRFASAATTLIGPAALDLADTTVLIPPGWSAAPSHSGIRVERLG